MAEANIDIKLNGIALIKKELRELKSQLDDATDPEQMAELAKKAGELSDRLKDANERVAVFASGSPFEQTNNALGLMGSQLMSLDFEGAAESSKLFASAAKGINGDMIAKSLKSLTSVIFNVGKAFMSVGLSLLTNPIFLIAAAIVALVAIIILLMNKLGILKPILDAIGKVFGFIMKIVDAVIAGFKMLTDWLGLTANAAEDSAKRQIAASENMMAALERNSAKRIDAMDHEIAMSKAAGKDVAIAEAKKQQYIIMTTKQRVEALETQYKLHKKIKDLEAADLKKLKDSLDEEKKALLDANQALQVMRIENAKKVEENEKKVSENTKKIQKERADTRKQFEADRLAAIRTAQDLELELLKDGVDKDLKANKIKYARLIEDTNSNEKLKASEKMKIIKEYQMLESKYRDEINAAHIKSEKEKQDKINKTIKDAQLLRDQEQEDFDQLYRENTMSKQQIEIDAVNDKYFQLIEQAKQYGYDIVELEKRQKEELEKINEDARKKDLAKEQALKQAKLDLMSGGLEATQQLVSAFAGKSESAQRKAFEIQKKLSIAQAIMDTYKAANSIFASAALNPTSILFPAQPFIQAGLAIVAGIANVKKIASTQFGGGTPSASGGSSGGGSMGGGNSTQQATPNVSLFGQGNNQNNVGAPKDQEATTNMVVQAVVVESEITATQNKVKKMKENASL
jgi:hypothetical protein